MAGWRRFINRLLTFDITGRTWVKQVSHPYFRNLIHFGSRKSEQAYWEAEVIAPDGKPVEVLMNASESASLVEEQRFCERLMGELDSLWNRCRPVIEADAKTWPEVDKDIADRLSGARLASVDVPIGGDSRMPWEACYFLVGIDHYVRVLVANEGVKVISDG